ncbi:uncharacterized protein HaLaN_11138, partial [Haematococcus lacustris]
MMLEHWATSWLMAALSVASVGLLAAEHQGMADQLWWQLVQVNWALSACFLLEVVSRLLVYGPLQPLRSAWDGFELVLGGLAAAEVAMEAAGGIPALRGGMYGLVVVRSLRALRLLRLFRVLTPLLDIGQVLVSSLGSFTAIAVLILLF